MPLPPRRMPPRLRRRPTRQIRLPPAPSRLPVRPKQRPMRRNPKSTSCPRKWTACSRSRCRNNPAGWKDRDPGHLSSNPTRARHVMALRLLVEPKLDSANDDFGADVHPSRKPPDLLVGDRDAAVRPVERLVYPGVAAADAVYTQAAAKRRVLGRQAMVPHGLDDGIQVHPADDSLGIGAPGNAFGRIIEAVKGAEAAATIDPGYVENPERSGLVAAAMDLGCATAADGDILKACQDAVFSGKHRQGKLLGVNQDPRLPPTCPGDCGCPQECGDKQDAQRPLENPH